MKPVSRKKGKELGTQEYAVDSSKTLEARDEIVDQILKIGKDMGYVFSTNDLHWDGNQTQTCIGIPTKKQTARRKIWRGFFWVKPESNSLEFWLPKQTNLIEFSRKTNLPISKGIPTHSEGGKKNSFVAFVPLNKLDLTKTIHRKFIKEVINLNRT